MSLSFTDILIVIAAWLCISAFAVTLWCILCRAIPRDDS
jgi:hypothetical protein